VLWGEKKFRSTLKSSTNVFLQRYRNMEELHVKAKQKVIGAD